MSRKYRLSIESPKGDRTHRIATFQHVGPMVKRIEWWRQTRNLRGMSFIVQNMQSGYEARFQAHA